MEITVIGVAIFDGKHRCFFDRRSNCALTCRCAAHRNQAGGVVFRGVVQDLAGFAFFHFFAMAQDLDTVCDLGNHGQIMGDVQSCGVVLTNQRFQQDQHFNLRGYVQRSRGFIQNQHVRAAGHRHRRHRTLQLSA